PQGNLPHLEAMGGEAVLQTGLLQRARQGRPLRRLRAAGNFRARSSQLFPSNAITPLHSTFWREGHETDFTNQLATGASNGVHHWISVGAIRNHTDEGSGQLR